MSKIKIMVCIFIISLLIPTSASAAMTCDESVCFDHCGLRVQFNVPNGWSESAEQENALKAYEYKNQNGQTSGFAFLNIYDLWSSTVYSKREEIKAGTREEMKQENSEKLFFNFEGTDNVTFEYMGKATFNGIGYYKHKLVYKDMSNIECVSYVHVENGIAYFMQFVYSSYDTAGPQSGFDSIMNSMKITSAVLDKTFVTDITFFMNKMEDDSRVREGLYYPPEYFDNYKSENLSKYNELLSRFANYKKYIDEFGSVDYSANTNYSEYEIFLENWEYNIENEKAASQQMKATDTTVAPTTANQGNEANDGAAAKSTQTAANAKNKFGRVVGVLAVLVVILFAAGIVIFLVLRKKNKISYGNNSNVYTQNQAFNPPVNNQFGYQPPGYPPNTYGQPQPSNQNEYRQNRNQNDFTQNGNYQYNNSASGNMGTVNPGQLPNYIPTNSNAAVYTDAPQNPPPFNQQGPVSTPYMPPETNNGQSPFSYRPPSTEKQIPPKEQQE